MRITAIQLAITDKPEPRVLDRVLGELDRAIGSDLILLPELWSCGYFSFAHYRESSEPLDGPLVTALAAKAVQLRAHVFAGSLVERCGDDLYNTSILLSPTGQVIASYRKIHLFGIQSDERRLLKPGNRVVVVDTPWGKAGLSTCYDLRFPELYRSMVDQGADFFLVTAAWPRQRVEAWKLFNRARAHENLAFLFSCNCAGSSEGAAFAGHSQFVDPLGVVIAEAGEGETFLSAEVDLGAVARTRASFTALHDRTELLNPKMMKGSHA